MVTFILVFVLLFGQIHALEKYHLLKDAGKQSADMMSMIRKEISFWKYRQSLCEPTALKGIKRLVGLNSSHPVSEGISLIYFIEKENSTQDTLYFGSAKAKWLYHCCIGFKDLYLVRDWFIDLSYHCMVDKQFSDRMKRIISKEQYLANIPRTVDTFAIPSVNLEYFIRSFYSKQQVPRNYFDIANKLRLMFVFDPIYRTKEDGEVIKSMLSRTVIVKYSNLTRFHLPIIN